MLYELVLSHKFVVQYTKYHHLVSSESFYARQHVVLSAY